MEEKAEDCVDGLDEEQWHWEVVGVLNGVSWYVSDMRVSSDSSAV